VTALSRLLATSSVRISLAATGVIVVTALVVGATLYWRTTALITAELAATLRAEVQGLREQYAIGGTDLLAATIDERTRQAGANLYLLVDTNGRRRAGNLDRLPDELAGQADSDLFHYKGGGQSDAMRTAVGLSIQVPGGGRLIVGRDVEAQRQHALAMQRTLWWGIGALSLVSLLAGVWAGRRLLARVETITAASRAIMDGNLSERVPETGGGDEMDRLAQGLNAMLDRIEHLMNSLKEVSDNIAHDLKTPLNRMRQRADAALRSDGECGTHRQALHDVIEDADDLIKTFNALLSIARLEAGAMPEAQQRIDLGAAVRDIAELYEPAAEEMGAALSVSTEPDIVVQAHRELIGQAVANLVDNAIKYSTTSPSSAHAASIEIVVRRAGDAAELIVADHGPGIPEADRERALRRFVRLEASRTRPGTGLGLSLVAAVARLHGGSVSLSDNAPGLRVCLNLPLAPASTPTVTATTVISMRSAHA